MASTTAVRKLTQEKQLADDIAQFYADPYGYVLYAFPWGVKGTRLENETGPDTWQKEQLDPFAVWRREGTHSAGIGILSVQAQSCSILSVG